jgi:hypothetical protein
LTLGYKGYKITNNNMAELSKIIGIRGATAIDSQCDEVVSGNLLVKLADPYIATATCFGSLLTNCASHHVDHKMDGGKFPQHDLFTVYKNDMRIGEFIVTSAASEVGIKVYSIEIKKELENLAREFDKSIQRRY